MSRPLDSAPDIDARYREMMHARSASERVVMACAMFDVARAAILSSLPDGSDDGTRRVQLFRRLYGRDFDGETAARIAEHIAAWPNRVHRSGD